MATQSVVIIIYSLPDNFPRRLASDTSGGKAAILSRTAASDEAEFSKSSRALISSSVYR